MMMLLIVLLFPLSVHAAWIQYSPGLSAFGTNQVQGIAAEFPGEGACSESNACVEAPGLTPEEVLASFPLPPGCPRPGDPAMELQVYRVASLDPLTIEVFPSLVNGAEPDGMTLFECTPVTSLAEARGRAEERGGVIDRDYETPLPLVNIPIGVVQNCGPADTSLECGRIRNKMELIGGGAAQRALLEVRLDRIIALLQRFIALRNSGVFP